MDEHVIRNYTRAPEVFVEGEGALLRDAEGNDYLDFLAGIGVSALGHAHPALTEALRDQVGKLLHVSNLYRHPYTEEVAALIAELTGLHAVFFCNSGAEAVETALKIARKHQRMRGADRTGFVALEGSFHGRTMGALSVTHTPRYRRPFEPLVPGVTFVPFGDVHALERALAAAPAALLIEPIQGESGVRVVPDDYLRAARELCDHTGTVLIHDEVQSGSGRTGRFLAAQHAGVTPDVVTLAKPIAAGLPLGVTVVREELAEVLAPGDHGSTFGGGPLACRAALVFLRACRDGLLDQVAERGRRLRAGLEAIAEEFDVVVEVRGRGLMQALKLSSGAADLCRRLHRDRLLANATGDEVVRFLPPFVVTPEQIDQGLDVIRSCLRSSTACS